MQTGEFMTVLIVDDHKGIRDLEKSLFASVFDTFYESTSGEEAISLFKKFNPDWILMDYKMKGMTGLEALKEIKQNNSSAKVIMVTQFDDVNLKKKALESGAVAFVAKEKLASIKNIILTNKEN
jgi:two-component system invasion response regulator UvrY